MGLMVRGARTLGFVLRFLFTKEHETSVEVQKPSNPVGNIPLFRRCRNEVFCMTVVDITMEFSFI